MTIGNTANQQRSAYLTRSWWSVDPTHFSEYIIQAFRRLDGKTDEDDMNPNVRRRSYLIILFRASGIVDFKLTLHAATIESLNEV